MVALEVLDGLPGTGEAALHFSGANPTPWREGFVVKLSSQRFGTWVGNFQVGHASYYHAEYWAESESVMVFSGGKLFLVKASDPSRYLSDLECAAGFALSVDRRLLVVHDSFDLLAYRSDWTIAWHHAHLGMDGIAIDGVTDGFVVGSRCVYPPDRWARFRIRLSDGKSMWRA